MQEEYIEEGQHVFDHHSDEKKQKGSAEPMKIDKRKLIIYSEIMKPKFED